MNILLARWLVASDYGAYSVCFSLMIVLAAFHNALILEPMTVVGPSEFQANLNAYFRANMRLNWLVTLALVAVALVFALFSHDPVVRSCLLVMALCLPGYVLLLTVRRKQYVINAPAQALRISLLYSALVVAAIYLLRATGTLTATTSVAALGMAWCAMLFTRSVRNGETVSLQQIASQHWRYGKWVFASALLAIGGSDLQTLLLSMLVDLKAAGVLRALMNFVLPLSQLLTVMSIYALPRLSSRAKQWGSQALLAKGMLLSLGLIGLTVVYLTVLIFFAPILEKIMYGGKLEAYLKWIPLLAASAFISAIGASFSTLLRAIQNSQHIFISGVASTIVGIACAFLLQRKLGLAGALWSLVAANSAGVIVILATYFVLIRRKHA